MIYFIYRSQQEISFNADELIDIFGDYNDIISWDIKEEGNFYYGVRALSYSNTLGDCNSIKLVNLGYYLSYSGMISILLIIIFL